jgi:hypothetical protein
MTLGGFPLYVFAPLVVGVVLALLLVWQLTVLNKALGIDAGDAADARRLSGALYGGENRLHDLGVHRTVWNIRLAFIGQTACILLFTYLIYRVIEVA